jgi:hypothetical protein
MSGFVCWRKVERKSEETEHRMVGARRVWSVSNDLVTGIAMPTNTIESLGGSVLVDNWKTFGEGEREREHQGGKVLVTVSAPEAAADWVVAQGMEVN